MGCNQCRKKGYQKVNYLAPDEKEISFKDYSSPNDVKNGDNSKFDVEMKLGI